MPDDTTPSTAPGIRLPSVKRAFEYARSGSSPRWPEGREEFPPPPPGPPAGAAGFGAACVAGKDELRVDVESPQRHGALQPRDAVHPQPDLGARRPNERIDAVRGIAALRIARQRRAAAVVAMESRSGARIHLGALPRPEDDAQLR